MNVYEVEGPGGTRIVEAKDEADARHKAMVMRWGDVSDAVVPRGTRPDGTMEPYCGYGLSVRIIR